MSNSHLSNKALILKNLWINVVSKYFNSHFILTKTRYR